jgi:hypothetical protein
MWVTSGRSSQIVGIVSQNDSLLLHRERGVSIVLRAEQASIACGGYVNASQAQTASDIVIHVFIKMKPNHGLLPCF